MARYVWFDSALANIAERDIDLLLMEEFHVTDAFVEWFCGQFGLTDVTPDGAWHSVSDAGGETDLLLRVMVAGRRTGNRWAVRPCSLAPTRQRPRGS